MEHYEAREYFGAFLVVLGYVFISVAYWIALNEFIENMFGGPK